LSSYECKVVIQLSAFDILLGQPSSSEMPPATPFDPSRMT